MEREFPKDATGKQVKVGDRIRGEGFLHCHGGFKIDRTPIVTVTVQNGVLYFGSLSALSFRRFWIVK